MDAQGWISASSVELRMASAELSVGTVIGQGRALFVSIRDWSFSDERRMRALSIRQFRSAGSGQAAELRRAGDQAAFDRLRAGDRVWFDCAHHGTVAVDGDYRRGVQGERTCWDHS